VEHALGTSRAALGWGLAVLALAAGCQRDPAEGGVIVGNPTKGMTARVAPASDIATLDGTLDVHKLRIESCDGAVRVAAEDVLLSPTGDSLVQLPEGTWCRLELEFGSAVALTGANAAGGTFDLSLDVDRVRVRSDVGFSTDTLLVFVLGPVGWLSGAALGLEGEGSVTIEPGHPRHDALVAAITGDSFLGHDDDDDGELDDGHDAESDDDGEPLDDHGGGGDDDDPTGASHGGRGGA
jgi:hypothetical protein